MKTKISLEEAQTMLKSCFKPTGTERVSIFNAHQRVLAQDILAPIDQPPFDRSPVDGYAMKASDSTEAGKEHPVKLQLIEEVCAGQFPEKEVAEKTACRIMTGAPIPRGADCVIRQEETSENNGYVEIHMQLLAGENYCYQGEDIKKGEHILKKDDILNYAGIGILASMGITEVLVYKIPKVAVLSTGDELTPIDEKLQPGKIYNSNLFTIGMRLKEFGMEPVIVGNVADHIEESCLIIKEELAKADILITIGGVSVGKKDLVKEIMKEVGADILFWKVNMKPGTPVLASSWKGKPILSLSGNPAAASISLELLVRDFLAYYAHRHDLELEKSEAILENSFAKESKRRRILRGRVVKRGKDEFIELVDKHSPGVLSSLYRCNCLVDVPAGTPALDKGQSVTVYKLQTTGS